jgi:hypothetical protein
VHISLMTATAELNRGGRRGRRGQRERLSKAGAGATRLKLIAL